MVKALKGDPMHPDAYFFVKIGGVRKQFDQSNRGDFVKRIPRALAKMILRKIDDPAILVPIPNSHVTEPNADSFRTLELAKAVADESGGKLRAVPALVFHEPQQKSREGGSRDPDYFVDAYERVAVKVEGPVVLIDDVCTSGAHMIGAYRKLHLPPRRDVVLACAFGRTTWDQINEPLGPREETLDVRSPFDF
jgi:predicted amidophosphoribosyltransferase